MMLLTSSKVSPKRNISSVFICELILPFFLIWWWLHVEWCEGYFSSFVFFHSMNEGSAILLIHCYLKTVYLFLLSVPHFAISFPFQVVLDNHRFIWCAAKNSCIFYSSQTSYFPFFVKFSWLFSSFSTLDFILVHPIFQHIRRHT